MTTNNLLPADLTAGRVPKPAPLCRDCTWHEGRAETRNMGLDQCAHEASGFSNLINGSKQKGYCAIERTFGKCGPAGALFDAKKPF